MMGPAERVEVVRSRLAFAFDGNCALDELDRARKIFWCPPSERAKPCQQVEGIRRLAIELDSLHEVAFGLVEQAKPDPCVVTAQPALDVPMISERLLQYCAGLGRAALSLHGSRHSDEHARRVEFR